MKKKTKSTPKKSIKVVKKPAAKKTVKAKPVKKAVKSSKKPIKTSAKKVTLNTKSKPIQQKVKLQQKTVTPAPSKLKKNSNGMNYFQQCVVLAALINQERHYNQEFQTIPLPEITSSLLGPIRDYLGQYAFNSEEIQHGLDELMKCDLFKKTFPIKHPDTTVEISIEGNPKKIMAQLLELAGPEARKIIFLKEEGNRMLIHRTTLEKYALKTGQIEHHILHQDSPNYMSHESTHRDILNQINQRTNPRYFGQDHAQNFSTKQRRGRG